MKRVRIFTDIYGPLLEHTMSDLMKNRVALMCKHLWKKRNVTILFGVTELGPKLGRAYFLNFDRCHIHRYAALVNQSVMRGQLRFFQFIMTLRPSPFEFYYYYIDWLKMACRCGHVRLCHFLIQHMISIRYEFPFLDKALKTATKAGHSNICALLVRNGAKSVRKKNEKKK